MEKVIKIDRIIIYEAIGMPEDGALEYMSPTGDLSHPMVRYANKNTETGEVTNISPKQSIEIQNQ